MKYQHIFLDLDNTILDFTQSQAQAFERLCNEIGLPFRDAILEAFIPYNMRLWEQIESGTLTKDTLLETRFPNFFAEYGIALNGKDTDNRFRQYLADSVNLVEGAVDFLQYLRESNYRVYAATNGVYNTQISRLKNANLMTYFDKLFISEQLGVAKPHVAFFERSVAQLREPFDKTKALMVGDSLSSDIKGANNFGIDACWLNPTKAHLPKELNVAYNVCTLNELQQKIG